MTKKEISELRRRLRPDRNAIGRVYGCYVNSRKEVISYLDESLGTMPQEEARRYLELLGKVLSGRAGRNLIDIVFSTRQVADSEEHRRLMALRDCKLKDREAREEFYQRVIANLEMEDSNYLILLAHDSYDLPRRGGRGEERPDGENRGEDSQEVFSYLLCCVCPVKDGKQELGYCPGENEFHSCVPAQVVASPELGFLFPAFDDRTANLYNALAYTKSPDKLHQEFLDAIFHVEPPMSAGEQREAFEAALAQSLGEGYSFEVLQAVHGRLAEKIQENKDSRDPEPPAVTAGEIGGVLRDCGVAEERITAFRESCARQFGEGAVLAPMNLIDAKRFQVRAGEVTVTLPPERSCLLESRVIDGRRYLLVPVEEKVEVNGEPVELRPDGALSHDRG